MKKRKDPAGYPGDDRITQRYNEVKEMVRKERGLSAAALEHMMRSTYEEAVARYAPFAGRLTFCFVQRAESTKLRPQYATARSRYIAHAFSPTRTGRLNERSRIGF